MELGDRVRVKEESKLHSTSSAFSYAGREGRIKDICFGMFEVQFDEKDEYIFYPEELEVIDRGSK